MITRLKKIIVTCFKTYKTITFPLYIFLLFYYTFFFIAMSTGPPQPGYASIDGGEGPSSSSSPLLSSSKGNGRNWSDRINRSQHFIKRNLLHILVLFIIAVILLVLLMYTLVPESSMLPNKETYSNTIKLGVSETTMHLGRVKCESIKLRKRSRNKPNEKRSNPRAETLQKPLLLKNAIVWDGQGGILDDVDVYVENGVIRQVEKGIELKDLSKVQVIDVAGHILSPGLVDMHRYSYMKMNRFICIKMNLTVLQ